MPQTKLRLDVEAGEETPDLAPARANVSAFSTAPIHQKNVPLGTVEPPFQALIKYWSKPAIAALALIACALGYSHHIEREHWALAVIVMIISRQVFTPLRLLTTNSTRPLKPRAVRLLAEWLAVIATLVALGYAFGLNERFPRPLIEAWFGVTLVALLVGDYCSVRVVARRGASRHRHIVIGANEVGLELARRVAESAGPGTFMGFFDFRSRERLPVRGREQFAGQCKDVAEFVRRHAVNAIYIALPMSNAPRIEALLNEFRDTTASIYFVPDVFAFDLVQARCVEINGMPLLSICDTPFHGMNAVKKRAMDIILSSATLLVTWPLMAVLAVAVKLSGPGPVLFKQRRYGLNGEEILVYKFRTMTVCEDGPVVEQAKPKDTRITGVGRILRRTSLDELPQVINVLEGKMSFVGPRPHAVVHNELYRKLISGYMLRHKIRPGMTGWAQVHGLRGETTTVEQMRMRAQYDLDYLRNWTPWLDVKILFRTALIVMQGHNAH